MTRRIAIVTSARSDFGLLQPVIAALMTDPAFVVTVFASGMHHSLMHGHTIDEVRAAIPPACLHEVPVWQSDDTAGAVGHLMASALEAFTQAFVAVKPELLLVLGDRFDMFPAVLAAMPLMIPIAHISGGEITEGVIDDAIRHAITKLSHVHFPSQKAYAERLERMGEESWRVIVTGEPGLDALRDFPFRTRAEVLAELNLDPALPLSIVTCHPETLEPENTRHLIESTLAAADQVKCQIVITYPNGDPGSDVIIKAIERYCDGRPGCVVWPSLGRHRFLDVLNQCVCMVGNSSSGIVETASFALPTLNLGLRQSGRLAPRNVIALSDYTHQTVLTAWRRAIDPTFRATLVGMENPYGDGYAVERIVTALKGLPLDRTLLHKKFVDGVR